jgi:hypothetical protein
MMVRTPTVFVSYAARYALEQCCIPPMSPTSCVFILTIRDVGRSDHEP